MARSWPVSRPRCAFAGHVHDLGGGELADLLGDEPVVPGPPWRPRSARRGRRSPPPPRRGRAGRWRPARGWRTGSPGAGTPPPGRYTSAEVVPVLAEQVGHAGDRPADRGHERVPGLRVPDRVAEHVAQPAACRTRAAAAASRRTRRARRRRAARCPARGRGPRPVYASTVAAAGAVPCPQTTNVSPRRASWPMTGTSPPGPFRCGSTTWSTNPAATAASNALPPRSSTAIPPPRPASGWTRPSRRSPRAPAGS